MDHSHSSYVNQNAFSNVVIGNTTIAADKATDTLTLVAGSNITLTPDATNDKITIAATDTNTAHAHAAGDGISLAGSGGVSGTTTISLSPSGVTAGTYGPSANVSGTDGKTINVPEIVVDDYGRITSITNRVYISKNTANTDTKNTAGSTDTSSKIYLIGATSQAANPQTYSHDTAYVGTDGCLYSGGTKVLTSHQSLSNYSTLANTIKGLSVSGKVITYTRGDGTTGTITTQDTNTTYTDATTSKSGLMSSTDKSNLDTLVTLLNQDSSADTIDSIREVLEVFESYPEGASIVDALALKSAKTHTHNIPAQTITVTGASYTPAGTISKITPAGTVTVSTPSGTISKITPSGTVSVGTPTGTISKITPSGDVSVTTQTLTMNSFTPKGTVSAPTITVTPNTTNVYSITAVGTLPSLTVTSKDTSKISSWSAGTVPTRASFTYGKGDITGSFENGVLTISQSGSSTAYQITGVGTAPSLSYRAVSVGSASG